MKSVYLTVILFITITSAFAQSVRPAAIEDSMIGWMKIYNFKGAKQPLKVDHRVYSVNQLSICDSFANWMQASYTPKGALGDMKKVVSERLGPYNKNTAALPQTYGASARTYFFLKYNSKKKFELENTLHVAWEIIANWVPGWEIRTLSTPSQYYFTMPSFESSANSEAVRKAHDLSNVPNVKPYIKFWVKYIEGGMGADHVLLSKNNRMPFLKLTKGEYLKVLEAAITRYRETEKKTIYEQNPGNQRSIDYFMKALDEKIERMIKGLKDHLEKYKNRLDEIALTGAQPSVTDLDNGRDVFSNGYLTDAENTTDRMPVYKVDPGMAELCKTDQPQWITISWAWTPNNTVERHLHESIINNFNFDYVYKFFFEPEKVKGQPYKQLRSPNYKEAVVVANASETSKKNANDKRIHFFEDFSTTEIGKKPIGWQNKLGPDGTSSIVKHVDGLEGNWAVIGNSYVLSPNQLTKPLPQNFTLTYDLVASQNFTWGSKGLTLQLSKETSSGNAESYLRLKLRPGFDGREGETEFETKFDSPPGYLTGTKWFKAPGFSNDKKNNRVTVTIKKKDESLQVFIDKNKIVEYEKALPATLLFNALTFSNGTLGENDRYYIGNIKITKD